MGASRGCCSLPEQAGDEIFLLAALPALEATGSVRYSLQGTA